MCGPCTVVECLCSTYEALGSIHSQYCGEKECEEITVKSTDIYSGFVEFIFAQTLNTKYRQLFMGFSV